MIQSAMSTLSFSTIITVLWKQHVAKTNKKITTPTVSIKRSHCLQQLRISQRMARADTAHYVSVASAQPRAQVSSRLWTLEVPNQRLTDTYWTLSSTRPASGIGSRDNSHEHVA
jgi:hypothetical protein